MSSNPRTEGNEVVIAEGGAIAPRVLPAGHDRAQYIGSSDIAGVLGVSRFETPLDVYRLKVGEPTEIAEGRRRFFERRKLWEPVVFATMREELDAEIIATNVRYADPLAPWLASEIDAEVREGNEVVNVEVKTVDQFAFRRGGWGEPGTGDIPVEYEAQVQQGLGITRRRRTIVAAQVGLDKMLLYVVERNERVIERMREVAAHFWHEHVLARRPPEPANLADVEWLYPREEEAMALQVDGELAVEALRMREIDAHLDKLQFERDRIELQLRRAMGKAEYLLVEGQKVASWRAKNVARFDIGTFKLREPKAYKAHLVRGIRREFRVLKEGR